MAQDSSHVYQENRPSRMDRATFLEVFGGVYEHSPWIAEAAYEAGLAGAQDNAESLHAALVAVVEAADREAKLALLRAHPDLAGKLALAGALTHDSAGEQAGAGLDRCSPDELARFQALNARYRERFGFPFVIAVKGLTRREILAAFERRIENGADTEFEAALAQVHRIALLRLRAIC